VARVPALDAGGDRRIAGGGSRGATLARPSAKSSGSSCSSIHAAPAGPVRGFPALEVSRCRVEQPVLAPARYVLALASAPPPWVPHLAACTHLGTLGAPRAAVAPTDSPRRPADGLAAVAPTDSPPSPRRTRRCPARRAPRRQTSGPGTSRGSIAP
jgi:hypothetical protein